MQIFYCGVVFLFASAPIGKEELDSCQKVLGGESGRNNAEIQGHQGHQTDSELTGSSCRQAVLRHLPFTLPVQPATPVHLLLQIQGHRLEALTVTPS